MIKPAIAQLVNNNNLSCEQTRDVFKAILEKQATAAQIASFLTALSIKGETEPEILGAVLAIREKAVKINPRSHFLGKEDKNEPVLDTCSTGGSRANKFNISTAAAFVAAAGGIKTAKHGNRSASGCCGSADILEKLGINITAQPTIMEKAIQQVGIGFLFAPLYHPTFKEVVPIRKEIGIRTIFNIAGPLCNPAFPSHQLLGVFDRNLLMPMAKVLRQLGVKKAMVVFGKDLKDEISLTGQTNAAFLNNKKIEQFNLSYSDFGLKKSQLSDIQINTIEAAVKCINDVFDGKKGHCRDHVLAAASACFFITGKVKSFKEGVKLASRLIDEAKAKEKLLELKQFLTNA
jgi:anthranilate phosphoribosyltransferase